jgi:hypothetical protein
MRLAVFVCLIPTALAWTPPSRRAVLATTASTVLPTLTANALDACPARSKNCIRTAWTPPASSSKGDVVETLVSVLNEYPQQGQDEVDLGGWKFAENDLATKGTSRLEFMSGIGPFSKFLNGGKPFVDDVQLEIGGGNVQVRSSSRIGESDLGVNRKRLQFIAAALRAKGWDAPEPSY